MHASDSATEPRSANGLSDVQERTLIDVFLERRSRRFALGADLHGGAMDFKSAAGPVPLSTDEEAILAFAGSGVTGRVYGELPYQPLEGPETGGGQIMMSMVGRTQSSADAVATATLFILRDDGTYAMRRPQDFAPDEYEALVRLGREQRFTEMYERSRIAVADHRLDDPARGAVHAALQQVVSQHPGCHLFRAGHGGHGALPDDPLRGARRGVRLLLPRRQGLAAAPGRDLDGSASRRAATCTTTSTTAASGRSTRSRPTSSRSAASSRA